MTPSLPSADCCVHCPVLYREVMGTRIPGGSEDVLLDLAVRQLVKIYKTQTKVLEAQGGSRL